MEELRGQRILVIGLGLSGQSAAAFCARQGARVLAVDERPDVAVPELPAEVAVQLGRTLPDPADFDLVVPSPGVPRERYAERARRVWGDLEIAFRALRIPVVAVTGTNGKSTTTRLVEAMLRAAGWRAMAAGNVGHPALDLPGRALDAAVLEVSSFQLEAVETFRPRVGVLLNVTPDHFDRHGSLAGYRQAKARLFANQQAEDTAVLNAEDPWQAQELAPSLRARKRFFRERGPVADGAFLDGDMLCLRGNGGVERFRIDGLPSALAAFPANLLAAALAVHALGADLAAALGALPSFTPLPHRAERVAERDGVLWVDDSKATNPGAATAALTQQRRPVVWIAGGRDKGLPFESLADAARDRVRAALLIGESAPAIARALADQVSVEVVGTLEAAVDRAREIAKPGDVVLLSPACASFDQFRDYADRGRRFQALVRRALGEERP
jgi:UDP-N-acetylmuramoylalanine--D-glutamate ligase